MSSTASQISDFNLLRRCAKSRSSKKNGSSIAELYNNLYASQMVQAVDQRVKMSPQRTISLGSLHHPPQTQYIEPARLSQLETLEAKMASIEVSLSATLKRPKKSVTPVVPSSPLQPATVAQKTVVTPVKSCGGVNGYAAADLRDKEKMARNNVTLQTLLVDDETNEHSKHGNQNDKQHRAAQSDTVNESEKQSLTQKIESLKTDMDQKRLAIKNIKMSLEQLDVTDNIDTRIQQAELEYQLGREDLNLLSLMEDVSKYKCRLEEIEQHIVQNENNTLYNYLVSNPGSVISLRAVEFEYDPKSPKFGVGSRKDKPGLFIDWTTDDLGLSKGDRLLEVNGKVVLSVKSGNDLNRLLEVSPSSVRAVVMRDGPTADQQHRLESAALRRELDACRARAEDADRSRHAYKTENVRLAHRVSYLEDQVSELIKCRSAAGPADGAPAAAVLQLFQRGGSSAMVQRSKSPKHGVSAIQQYKRERTVYDDGRYGCSNGVRGGPGGTAQTAEGPVKTRIRTVPRLCRGGGGSASVESLAPTAACKSHEDLASPKRNRYPGGGGGGGGGGRNSRTRHIREAQQTLFRFLDSESSAGGGGGGDGLLQQYGGGAVPPTACSVRSLDLQRDERDRVPLHHRHKSDEYYSRLLAAAESPRAGRSLNYDSEQSGRRGAPVPPKKPMRLSLQQRHRKSDGEPEASGAEVADEKPRHHQQQQQQHHHLHRRRSRDDEDDDDDDVDLSAINNTFS